MDTDAEIKQQVRKFYDRVGWQEQSDGFYQNASYEDLRPVSQEYIHNCHMRVLRHLNPNGRFLLDAGSGPIQYPEYLEYSRRYQYRVCADISIVALCEARQRIGEHGLYVVCDVALLPFKSEAFDGEVSLHTLHHLPSDEHVRAYQELYRTLARGGKSVVVNGWDDAPLSNLMNIWIGLFDWIYRTLRPHKKSSISARLTKPEECLPSGRGTYVQRVTASWLQVTVGKLVPVTIWCWRSLSVRFMRTMIHERFGGRLFLRLAYWKEERLPHFFGKYGQYPLVELNKK
jgi:SAM-dependent methyltransferase